MSDNRSIQERIAEVAAISKGGKRGLAERAEISESYLHRVIAGKSIPTLKPLLGIARAANVSLDWLVDGYGPRNWRDEVGWVGVYEDGIVRTTPEVVFSLRWLKRFHGIDGYADYVDFRVFYVKDESMSPAFKIGDQLLIDTRRNNSQKPGVYLVEVGRVPQIRRVEGVGKKKVKLLADNPKFEPTEISTSDSELFKVIGQVLWLGRIIGDHCDPSWLIKSPE